MDTESARVFAVWESHQMSLVHSLHREHNYSICMQAVNWVGDLKDSGFIRW